MFAARLAPGPRRALGLLAVWFVIAFAGPLLAPHAPGEIVDRDVFAGVSLHHWLGTDYLGRDLGSRLLWGVRYTVLICTLSTLLSCCCGIVLGIAATATSVWVERVLGRLMDGLLSIPSLLFALLVIAAAGESIPALILTMGVIYMPGSYRTSRALALRIARADYVTAALARGEGRAFVILREILPNMTGPLLSDIGLRFVYAVLLLSNLSFLGLGVQPPLVDLGSLVRENVLGLAYGAPAVVVPTLVLALLTVGINLALDGRRP
ncbi:ABC transporter permease [Gluconacetobacter azotocaptans]|uniref:ABC transporter permease n=2 Tax=Gluconacetobacter azotocaptans TaxID=142834 RepID=A0A7W4JPE2_9PROT|nr:ABC transporter permease [Gluconacetobacter azotocaptans]MBB2188464.1 ABC transporter permease [Gluconacetobacter azotocaptans]MBM9400167.1 ABC transporter permease [Gluconacetobacter azotocaptans]